MEDDNQRIVVSGVGVVSPFGVGKEPFWQGLKQGISAIKPINSFGTENYNAKLGGQIPEFNYPEILGESNLRNLDRLTIIGLCATKNALADAGLNANEGNAGDIGIVIGSAMGSIRSISNFDKQAIIQGPRSIEPGQCPNVVICSPASQISIKFKIKGFTATITAGIDSSFEALAYSIRLLKSGSVKYILCGAVEELSEQLYKGLYKLKLLSGSKNEGKEINAPFDKRRNGLVLGEGGGVFLLESLKSARERRVKNIYAEVSGFYSTELNRDSAKEILKTITRETDFISLGGNSSQSRDKIEASFIENMFDRVDSLPRASAIKSLIGESFSSGGFFQMLAAIFCMQNGYIFPTAGYEVADAKCSSVERFLTKVGLSYPVKRALVLNAGFNKRSHFVTLDRVDC